MDEDSGRTDVSQEEVDERDIKALFEKIAHHFEGADDSSREFFSMLVKTALRYRDMLAHSSGRPLTVGETRASLDAFMEVLRTHEMPKGLGKRVHDLVMMWLEQLKERTHN